MSNTDDDTPVRTGGGDQGQSSLGDGSRRFKDESVFDALGALDELQSSLGVCRSLISPSRSLDLHTELYDDLVWLQQALIACGGVLSGAVDDTSSSAATWQSGAQQRFEDWRRRIELEPRFYLAGDSRLGAELDRARAVARRAERRVVTVTRQSGQGAQREVSTFLNILSDLLFTLARWADEANPAD